MRHKISIPFITREFEFVSRHWDLVSEILEYKLDSPIKRLTDSVFNRALDDQKLILRKLEDEVSAGILGRLRIGWVNTDRRNNGESWARIYMPMGPMRSIGSVGIFLGENQTSLRLFGWVWPRWGGLEGRRELVRRCKKSCPVVCLPNESPKRYPGFTVDYGVIWLDQRFTLKSASDDMMSLVRRQAKRFFKSAKPVLKELANG